jgi:hypothetical protein
LQDWKENADNFQAYDIMKRGLGMSNKEMGDVFTEWNKGVLDSFLIEITRDIMYKNDDDGVAIVEKIMDSAGQKGTGKWTAINALDLGMPVTLIGEAVFARCLSSLKSERGRAAGLLDGPSPSFSGDRKAFIDNLEQALYASKIISYAQGFMLIQNVSDLQKSVQLKTDILKGRQGVQLEAEQARDRAHVARWLHYPIRLLEGHHKGVPRQPRARELALRRLLQQGYPQGAIRMERVSFVSSTILICTDIVPVLFPRVLSGVSPLPLSAPRSASTTDTAPRTCPPTCCRRSVTTSARTPSGSSQNAPPSSTRLARTFTSTGPDVAATFLPQ